MSTLPLHFTQRRNLYQHQPGLGFDNAWTVDLTRLRSEREFLEDGLANCVTYLHALRKKQNRNERQLNTDPPLPRRRRKQILQNKRELDKQIKNKERDEQAFLNNLQACKANIYIAEGLPYTKDILSAVPEPAYTSSTTQCSYPESEPTELSWNGWTDNAAISPFEKHCKNPFFTDEVPPDVLIDDLEEDLMAGRIKRPPPLIQHAQEIAILPVPPNTARSVYITSTLSPAAAVFESRVAPSDSEARRLDVPSSSNSTSLGNGPARRFTDVGLSQAFQELALGTQSMVTPLPCHTWCDKTPQLSPQEYQHSQAKRRSRSSSM